MKKLIKAEFKSRLIPFFIILCSYHATVYAQTVDSISLKMNKEKSYFFDEKYRSAADSAFKLANLILNSKEFKAGIENLSFDCESYCTRCNQIKSDSGSISGDVVLKKLYSELNVTLTLELNESGNALGETSDHSYYTKAWHDNILADMPDFSFAYGLAVNICHEYMHQVGFCHLYCTGIWPKCSRRNRLNEDGDAPDPKYYKDDVTYRVGWDAYYLLKKWKGNGKKLF